MSEIEKLIEIYKQLEDAGLMVTAGKKDAAELMVSRDVVPVVRCKDCRFSRKPSVLTQKYGLPGTLTCDNKNAPCNHRNTLEDSFCSYGERRTDVN